MSFANGNWTAKKEKHKVTVCVNEWTLLTAFLNERNKMGDSMCVWCFSLFLIVASSFFCAIHAKNVRALKSPFFLCWSIAFFFSSHLFPVCCWFCRDVIVWMTLGIILTFLFKRNKKDEFYFQDTLINWAKRHKLFIKMYSTKTYFVFSFDSLFSATIYFYFLHGNIDVHDLVEHTPIHSDKWLSWVCRITGKKNNSQSLFTKVD